jgi:hypothetical protein
MIFRMILALAGALALVACNPGAQLDDAEQQIKQFQALYNDGDPEAMYQYGGETFRAAATQDELKGMLALLDARLGTIESTERTGFNTAFNNGTTTTTVVMTTRFDQGEGSETYVFQGSGKDMELVGWTVNSPRLMLSADDVGKLTSKGDAAPPAR